MNPPCGAMQVCVKPKGARDDKYTLVTKASTWGGPWVYTCDQGASAAWTHRSSEQCPPDDMHPYATHTSLCHTYGAPLLQGGTAILPWASHCLPPCSPRLP